MDINKIEKAYKSFNFEFSELIQDVMNCQPKDVTDLLKNYMYAQKLFNLVISSKTMWCTHPALQKALDYVQKIEREFPAYNT